MEKKHKNIIVIFLFLFIVVIIGVSYAYWTFQASQETINRLNTNCLEVNIEEEQNNISLLKEFPITDKEAEALTPFTFKIHNTCNVDATYSVQLEVKDENDVLSDEYIALSYNGNSKELLNTYSTVDPTVKETDFTANKAYQITTGTIKAGEEKDFSLKLWVDESVDINDDAMNKNFTSKVTVTSENIHYAYYKEDLLNGADPVLGENLIPVIIDAKGEVKRANLEEKWYEYGKQEWANAVILADEAQEPEVGAVIDEDSIESYFVWIPRYKYKIWDEGNYTTRVEDETQLSSKVQPIEIQFETTNDIASNGSKATDWLTHPAFTAFGVNGIWVGKFESGYKDAESTKAAEVNPASADEAIEAAKKLQIKPNVYSWRSIQLANAHLVSYNYQRELDSHMMKNTEWGAVAYLTNSKYGRCKDNQCNDDSRVRVNNNDSHLTGYAARNNPTTGDIGSSTVEPCSSYPNACNEHGPSEAGSDGEYTVNYFNNLSTLASTTGNYTGIYDLSGGSLEFVLAGMEAESNSNIPASGQKISRNSGFKGKTLDGQEVTDGIDLPESKYYDVYSYSTNAYDYSRGILGDATKELGPFYKIHYRIESTGVENSDRTVSGWYKNTAFFPFGNESSSTPWFVRGGHFRSGFEAGPFYIGRTHGNGVNSISFRVVLAI